MTESALGFTTEEAARAHQAMPFIDVKIERAKSARQKQAFVFDFPRHEFKPPLTADKETAFDIKWLSGSALIIYRHCDRQGLKPTVETRGWNGQTCIAVHW